MILTAEFRYETRDTKQSCFSKENTKNFEDRYVMLFIEVR